VVDADYPDRTQIVTRARLTEIARPRVEEILQLVRARVRPEQIAAPARRLILTGGGSQLEGVVELAEEVFQMPVRLGQTRMLDGSAADPAAAVTAVGLVKWMMRDDGGLSFRSGRAAPVMAARLARIGQWLRENF
jgi:cell division protein FtsA